MGWQGARNLVRRGLVVYRLAQADSITGEAAKVAFYFFLALFPLIIVLFAFTGIVGGHETFGWVMAQLRVLLPDSAASYLADFVREVTDQQRPGLLSIGLVLSLWAAATGFDWLIRALNHVFAVAEARPWWKRRVLSLLATLAVLAAVSVSAALLSGPRLLAWLGIPRVWNVLLWPLLWMLLALVTWLIYRFMPHHLAPPSTGALAAGAFVATGVWLLATAGFRFYVARFGRLSVTYGTVGGVMVMLLWLHMTALAILLGAEVAAASGRDDPAAAQRAVSTTSPK